MNGHEQRHRHGFQQAAVIGRMLPRGGWRRRAM